MNNLQNRQIIYRSVNLFYAMYVFELGVQQKDIVLLSTSFLLFLVDTILLETKATYIPMLQIIRLMAVFGLAPIWIYKGLQYQNRTILFFGLTFILFDGLLYLYPTGFF